MDDPRFPGGHLVPPIYPASVYPYPDLDALDSAMDGKSPGVFYARDSHPNGDELAAKLAALEGGPWGRVTGSGMAALVAAIVPLVKAGDRIVASDQLYGKSTLWLDKELSRFGVTTTLVNATDLNGVRNAFSQPARVLYVETISNPLLRVADLNALAEIAVKAGARFLVDNTFATPILCQPLRHGAQLVQESLTKFIGGHSDVTLGFVGGTDPGEGKAIAAASSTWGLTASPFDCWLAMRSLETLSLRVRAACENAAELAERLVRLPGVSRVIYPGRDDHPDRAIARRILPDGCGHMLSFELAGGRDAAVDFLRKTGVLLCPSLGHSGTTISYPAATSHRAMSPEERKKLGVTDGLLRLSVGVEPVDEVVRALESGLKG
jgi:cystathionine beta-lyase/cystathionine gamma-synthase